MSWTFVFAIQTNHKPLLGLIGEKKGIPVNLAARIQRWSLFLSNYQCELVYRSGNENAIVDALSRLPLPGTNQTEEDRNCFGINLLQLVDSPVDSMEVEIESRRDNAIARVLESVLTGNWGCLLWSSRVVVPLRLRKKVLSQLHNCHPGVSRMKALSRSLVWLPNIDRDIETTVKTVETVK